MKKSNKPIKSEEKRLLRFSKIVVIFMLLSTIMFTIGMTIVFCFKDAVPDTLITEFFAFFGIEGGALGIIKVAETIQAVFTENKKEKKEEDDESDSP